MAEQVTEGPGYDGLPADPVVNLDAQKPAGKGAAFITAKDEDSPNLVTLLRKTPQGLEILRKLSKQVIEDFDDDWESTEPYRKRAADDLLMFVGELPAKEWPFQHAANMHMPMMFENLGRITATCFSELFGDWNKIFIVDPVGPDDEKVADILTKHGNWQLTEQQLDFYRQADRAMLMFFLVGDVVSHSFYDDFRRQNVHEVLTCDDFVVPFVHVTTRSDYSDVPHRTKILQKYRHELQAMEGVWEYIPETLERKPGFDDDPEQTVAQAYSKYEKIEIPENSRSAPHKLLWYEGWTDLLPTEEKRDRFVRVVVDYATKNPLCLEIYEEPNWQDKRRYERQLQEADHYNAAVKEHAAIMANLQGQMQDLHNQVQAANMAGMPLDPAAVAAHEQSLNPELYPPPPPPEWMKDPETGELNPSPVPPRKEPINLFVHSVCIEPLKGNKGLGLGRMQADFNRADNVMLNQVIDSATLANAGGIITAGDLGFKRPLSWSPGTVSVASAVQPGKLKESIFELQTKGANPQMFDLIDRIYRYAQSSAQAPDVLSGEPGKSGETFRGIGTRLEQATKVLSVPTRKFARTWLKPVIMNQAYLNSIYLPEEEIVMVNNDRIADAPEELRVGRRLYERDYRVQFVADLRFVSRQQRVQEADEVSQMFLGMPKMGLPLNLPAVQRSMRKSLEARGRTDMLPYLGPEMPPPPTPMAMPTPEEQMAQQMQQQQAQQQEVPPKQNGAPVHANGAPPAG